MDIKILLYIIIILLIIILIIYNINYNKNITKCLNLNKENKEMIFYDENNNLININNFEKAEQDLSNKYILPHDVVLELGGRYGTVSCIISRRLNDKNNLVVVEPDEKVWNCLENNKKNNNCEFNIVKGFISNKKLGLDGEGYGKTAIENNESNIPSYSLTDIQNKYNLKFNVLVADCEGFLEIFFDENPTFYDDLRMIIFEADYPEKCNYDKIRQELKNRNFIELLNGHQNVWIRHK